MTLQLSGETVRLLFLIKQPFSDNAQWQESGVQHPAVKVKSIRS